jgi:hypothetical protein
MVFDRARGQTILFGGAGSCGENAYCDDLWVFQEEMWSELTAEVTPGPRFGHAMAYDSRRNRVVLFGGVGEESDCATGDCQTTWFFAGGQWSKLP